MIVVHPMTAGADNKPAYTADDFRHTNNVWLSPADSGSTVSSSCVSGVREESSGPIATAEGLNVSIKSHSGIIYPFDGGSPYTYYVHDEAVTLPNVTQNWKIAIVVTDPSTGHGDTPGATVQVISANTPNKNINGLVIAESAQGVVSDVAPRLLTGTVIQTRTLEGLQTIQTTDNQRAHVVDTNSDYVSKDGQWECTYKVATAPPLKNAWWRSSELRMIKHNGTVTWHFVLQRLDSPWTGDGGNYLGHGVVPEDMRVTRPIWATVDPRYGVFVEFDPNGDVTFGRDGANRNYATMPVGAVIDLMGSYIISMANLA